MNIFILISLSLLLVLINSSFHQLSVLTARHLIIHIPKQQLKHVENCKRVTVKRLIQPNTENIHSAALKSSADCINRYLRYGLSESSIGIKFTYPSALQNPPQFISKYVKWHAEQMKCIRSQHCYMKNKNSLKIMLWECPTRRRVACRGIGDRFRGMITVLTIAMITGNVFVLQWPSKPFPFFHAVSPGAIDWRVPPHVENDKGNWAVAENLRTRSIRWQSCPSPNVCGSRKNNTALKRQTGNWRIMSMDNNTTYSALSQPSVGNVRISSVTNYSNLLLNRYEWKRFTNDTTYGFFNSSYVFHIERLLLRCLIRPSPIVERILQFYVPSRALQNGYVAVHARTGLETGETSDFRFRAMKKMSLRKIAKRFMACVDIKPGGYIMFASDSTPLKTAFAQVARTHDMHTIFSTIKGSHVGLNKVENEHNNDVVELVQTYKWKKFLNVFVEFFVIANGTQLISNKSEFSRLAHLLSDAAISGKKTFNASSERSSCRKRKLASNIRT